MAGMKVWRGVVTAIKEYYRQGQIEKMGGIEMKVNKDGNKKSLCEV